MTSIKLGVILFLHLVLGIYCRLDVDWRKVSQSELAKQLKQKVNTNLAKNVIVFIGDGMGPTTITASRFFKAKRDSTSIEKTHLSWDSFSTTGLAKTYNTDKMTADSSSTATAILTGYKSNFLTVGCNSKVTYEDCKGMRGNEVKSFLKEAENVKWTGVVTTTRVTHATPSAVYAHSPSRYYETSAPSNCKLGDIGKQLVNSNLRVILGGGKAVLTSPKEGGWRKDNISLVDLWQNKRKDNKDHYEYVTSKEELNRVKDTKIDYLMGLFSQSHMTPEIDRDENTTEPTLREMTSQAIRTLRHAPDGYFLLVEGGLIDKGHHANKARLAFEETLALDEAVKVAREMTSEDDTLIVVTSDHSHVMTFGAYIPVEGSPLDTYADPVWGPTDHKPLLAVQYADGPGYYKHRQNKKNETIPRLDLTNVDTRAKDFVQDSAVPLPDDTHGAEDVSIYASGPMSHLFTGTHEQSYIADAIRYASCSGGSSEHCDKKNVENSAPIQSCSVALFIISLFLLLL